MTRRTRLGRIPLRSRRVDQITERDAFARWLVDGYGLGVEPSDGDRVLIARLLRHNCTIEEVLSALLRRWRASGRRSRYPVEEALALLEEAA